jgi:hypothetical protein
MKIYKAVDGWLGQGFDSNPCMVEFYKKLGVSNHGGYDYGIKVGTPIYWNTDLEAETLYNEVDSSGGMGCNVFCKFEDRAFKFRFWHLSKFGTDYQDKLRKGTLLGWSGNTGLSTGPHLHFDAKELIKSENGKYKTSSGERYDQMYPNNGTFGTIRLDEWMENTFVLKTLSRKEMVRAILIAKIKNLVY